jgi:hypothetical protein
VYIGHSFFILGVKNGSRLGVKNGSRPPFGKVEPKPETGDQKWNHFGAQKWNHPTGFYGSKIESLYIYVGHFFLVTSFHPLLHKKLILFLRHSLPLSLNIIKSLSKTKMTSKTTSIFTPEFVEHSPSASALTVRQLLEFLQSSAAKDPEILDKQVCIAAGYHSVEYAHTVKIDTDEEWVVIA